MSIPFAQVVIFLLIIIGNITLLNFVIAILSNTYENIREKSQAVYLKYIIENEATYGYNKNFSTLVSGIPGIDIVLIPFMPLLFIF